MGPIPPGPEPTKQFNFLYKVEGGTELQEYVPTVNDIQVVDGKVTIVAEDFKAQSWFGNVKEVKLPSKWNNGTEDVDVTNIGEFVFDMCYFTSVTIPDSVTSIGESAFSNCSEIESVVIGNNVVNIESGAFSTCINLANITIPSSVKSIGDYAFYACYGLTSVAIPEIVTSIGHMAFYNCDNLANVTFSGKNKVTVQGMDNYSWYLPSGCVLHCTDGDITI